MRVYTRKHTHCIIEGCTGKGCGAGDKYFAKGYCHRHYALLLRNGVPERRQGRSILPEIPCVIEGCIGFTRRRDGLCKWHASRKNQYGDPEAIPENMDQAKGHDAENEVGMLLRSGGKRFVKRLHGPQGDLLIDDRLKIEVKTAAPRIADGKFSWQFNIHRHGILNEQADYYLFRFEHVPGCEKPIYAVYKGPLGVMTVNFSMRKMLYTLGPALQLFEDLKHGKLTTEVLK